MAQASIELTLKDISSADPVPSSSLRQSEIPREHREAGAQELHERITRAKAELGHRVVIFGHHYQRLEIVAHADYIGDSFMLAEAARNHPEAEAIVFCGALHGRDCRPALR